MTAIYGLTDPDTQMVRYVGKAENPKRRLQQHLAPFHLKFKTKKNSWIKSLLAEGKNPELILLSEVEESEANAEERRIISLLKDCGFDLTNGTNGGDGGAVTDPEAKERIRQAHIGRVTSDETKAKMSAAQKKRYEDPAEIEKQRQIALKAGCEPPHVRGSEVPNSIFTEELVAEIRRKMRSGASLTVLAREIGCSTPAVQKAATGKSWAHVDEQVYIPGPRNKLTDEDKREIYSLLKEGKLSQAEIARRFNVAQSHISNIKNKKR